jgi:hypothetical protein
MELPSKFGVLGGKSDEKTFPEKLLFLFEATAK